MTILSVWSMWAVIPLIIPGDSAPLCLSSIHTLINIIIILIVIIIIIIIAIIIVGLLLFGKWRRRRGTWRSQERRMREIRKFKRENRRGAEKEEGWPLPIERWGNLLMDGINAASTPGWVSLCSDRLRWPEWTAPHTENSGISANSNDGQGYTLCTTTRDMARVCMVTIWQWKYGNMVTISKWKYGNMWQCENENSLSLHDTIAGRGHAIDAHISGAMTVADRNRKTTKVRPDNLQRKCLRFDNIQNWWSLDFSDHSDGVTLMVWSEAQDMVSCSPSHL